MNPILRLIKKILPEDDCDICGYWIFNHGPDHPFTRACVNHDAEFTANSKGEPIDSLDDADWRLFNSFFYICRNAPTPEERLRLASDLCRYWPYARRYGKYLW